MFGGFKILIGIALLLLLGAIGIHWTGGAKKAERNLFTAAERTLLENEREWARISIDGQKITLLGVAPSSETIDDTAADLRKAKGFGGPLFGGVSAVEVSNVEIYESVLTQSAETEPTDTRPTPDNFIWRADFDGDRITITGHTPSAEAKQLIFNAVERQFQNTEIIDSTIPAKGVEEGPWIVAANASLTALAALERGSIIAIKGDFKLDGVADNDIRAETAKQLMTSLPRSITGASSIDVNKPEPVVEATPEPVTPSPAEQASACQSEIDQVMLGSQIFFASNQSIIQRQSRNILDQLAEVIRNCSTATILIEGHTDATGTEQKNQRLSDDRALAVKTYLTNNGVEAQILTTQGFGSTKPVASNATRIGRGKNRRIEFIVSVASEGDD